VEMSSEVVQPPVQWLTVARSPGLKRQGRELTSRLHLMPRCRMGEGFLLLLLLLLLLPLLPIPLLCVFMVWCLGAESNE